ncbi:CIC11C00000003070 [Sungouiella intermedia]|uniref:CIC11C00000003070 n=1 Tax=Sungouiella intermedia TaxID=45354 RepID=A0A1L0GH81_9ASCO|nr:CIC11C00000003070 [[Candida] intermedia]
MDRRRILVPSEAKVPILGQSSGAERPKRQFTPSEGVRSFFIKTGLSNNANGLAFLEVDDTIIEVSVFGPRPIKGSFIDRASFSVECKFLPYITQPNELLYNGGASQGNGRSSLTPIEQKISTYLETAFLPALMLEKYPKSTIDVFVNVLSFNSNTSSLLNLISWAVNCTSLALVDSGIEVRDLVTCGHVKYVDGKVELDPQISSENDSRIGTECCASFMAMKNNEVVALWIEGNDDTEVTEELLQTLTNACEEMSGIVRQNINGFLLQAAE